MCLSENLFPLNDNVLESGPLSKTVDSLGEE